MELHQFIKRFSIHPLTAEIRAFVQSDQHTLHVNGAIASGVAAMIAAAFFDSKVLVISRTSEEASYLYNDLRKMLPSVEVGVLPWSYKKSPRHGATDIAASITRTDALNILSSSEKYIIVTSPEGVSQRAARRDAFVSNRLTLNVDQTIDQDEIVARLDAFGFEEVDFVYTPGQYSRRGSIIDVFSFAFERPYRIDMFGDVIETIRVFDIENQLSVEQRRSIDIVPDEQNLPHEESRPVFDFIDPDTIIVTDDSILIKNRINDIFDDTLIYGSGGAKKSELENLINGTTYADMISRFRTIEISAHTPTKVAPTITFSQSPQAPFNKNFSLVADAITKYSNEGYEVFISSDSKKQTDRLAAILEEISPEARFTPVLNTVHRGFVDHDIKTVLFTDHQIFGRFHKFSLRSDIVKTGKAALTLKEINQLQINDFVVHINHGIGKFGGLVVMENNGRMQEMIKLIYAGGDMTFVPIHNLHKISKYKGKDNEPPRLNKLGGNAWERLKERTKSKVKDIARDLIRLYAARKAQQGYAFSQDSFLQHEMEASFLYEDTPDQAKSTAEVKRDMESSLPMDRLICGDVGFGKTEIAMRAAFKAIADNKQVAVLVPTTVLALQHFKTFSERLSDFPCTIEYLSRARKASATREIKQRLKEGKIDIIIGTHKLVGKDIEFKDLGLLIIDEEQKFGVATKERLKSLKVNVDTLTLTATPIPRTLQFSLMGARDLSILTTPPANRYPIATEVIEFDEAIIAEAINNEINRNGQVFFINNRVQSIYTIEKRLRQIVPEARIAVAHGQMPSEELETVITDFINYEYDVLVATSVVESGVDIPNVNTIIINNAQNFGLSDLHQLRGRVGRSNRKAWCFLITPPINLLTADARRRINAIETFADLGSGFSIAMQDLDIRGAGNILGAEQSGFIADLGFDTYQKIMNEALTELRKDEFADLFNDQQPTALNYTTDCQIETDLPLMFPAWYVESQSERFSLYRELDNLTDEDALVRFVDRLTDRFGRIPDEVNDLITIVRLRRKCVLLGVEKLVLKQQTLKAYFATDFNSPYYQSKEFGRIIAFCMKHPRTFAIAERDSKRFFTGKNITDVSTAYSIFEEIEKTAPLA